MVVKLKCVFDTDGDGDCWRWRTCTREGGCPVLEDPADKTTAPKHCMYCDGDDPHCGFCVEGVPLDTQEDWDNTWGQTFRAIKEGL